MINIQEMEQQAYTRDAELYNAIISLKRGDISAFDIIYQHTCKFMFYKAGQLLSGYYSKDSELKNDLVQDAYIKIFQGINSLQDISKFYGWINTILVHTVYAYTRAHWREEFDVVDEEGNSVLEMTSVSNETPEGYILEEERLEYIRNALDTLPTPQRCVVEYYYFSELSVQEIAGLCECSEGTVKSRLSYARQKLKGTIEEIEKTKGIKLRGVFAMPLLLFMFREKAYACELDAASVLKVKDTVKNTVYGNIQSAIGGNVMNDNQVNVSSISTSIWKTALGKVIIAVSIVIITAGLIMGGIFLFGGSNEEDVKSDTTNRTEHTDKSDDNIPKWWKDKDEEKETEETESEESVESSEETEHAKSIVDENGYIHVGTQEIGGTPITYAYKFHEDIPYHTDVRQAYFPLGEEVLVDVSYVKENQINAPDTIEKKNVIGAYQVFEWPEGLVIDGITHDDFINSGASGLYLDGSNLRICWNDENSVNAGNMVFFTLVGEKNKQIKMLRHVGTVDEQYQAGNIKPGDCLVPSFYVNAYGFENSEGEEAWRASKLGDGALHFNFGFDVTVAEKYEIHNFDTWVDHGNNVTSRLEFNTEYRNDSTYLIQSYSTYDPANLSEEMQKYLYSGYAYDGEEDNDDPNGVEGRMLAAMKNVTDDLLKGHYRKLAENIMNASTLLEKSAALEALYQPVTMVMFDREYKFYAYDANVLTRSDEYETYDGLGVWGYAIPTGNMITLEEADAANMSKRRPKDVEIPDYTLENIAFYDRESGLGKLKAIDEQIQEIDYTLQVEKNAYHTTEEQTQAVRTLLQMARELYFIVCADNACMKSYGDISFVEQFTDFGLADFGDIISRYEDKASFQHYVCVYMNQHIDCMDGRLKIIKEVLPIINREELTKTQKTALQMSKQLLNVFYENKGNYETVMNLYNEHAGRTYAEDFEYFRELTDYDVRLDHIIAYNELIAEFPTWVIPE